MYWRDISSDVYAKLKDCLSYASKSGTAYDNEKNILQFPPNWPLEFFSYWSHLQMLIMEIN